MPSFKNLTQIKMYLNDQIRKTIQQKIAMKLVDILKKKYEETVYSRPPSEWYERSGQVLESSTYNMKPDLQNILIDIFNDPSLMGYDYNSIMDDLPHIFDIVKWLNDGTSGSPIFNHPEHQFIEKAREQIFDEFGFMLQDELRKRGIKATYYKQ